MEEVETERKTESWSSPSDWGWFLSNLNYLCFCLFNQE